MIKEKISEILKYPYTKTMIIMAPLSFMHMFESRDSFLILGVVVYAFFSLSKKIRELEPDDV